GALEHLRVKIKTERVHVARLLAAEKISRAPQLQIQGRDSEARSEIGKLANRRQSPARNRRQLLFGRDQQVSVRPSIRSPHASAQLIKLRKTVIVGAIYDDGVGAWDVYSILDDRGGDQHVVLVGNEIKHDALHLFLVHLAVADGHAGLRHQTLDQRRDR